MYYYYCHHIVGIVVNTSLPGFQGTAVPFRRISKDIYEIEYLYSDFNNSRIVLADRLSDRVLARWILPRSAHDMTWWNFYSLYTSTSLIRVQSYQNMGGGP